MPPYREVYIWECTDLTDEEKVIVGGNAYCTVQFNVNGGDPPCPENRKVLWGGRLGELPSATRTGYALGGWMDSEGRQVSPSRTIRQNTTFYAFWIT